MDYNQYNSKFNQVVPPYPQPQNNQTLDYREKAPIPNKGSILDLKDSENSFVNAILKNAIGKEANFYFSYPDSIKWRDMMYEGKLMIVGEDYMVVREKKTGHNHVLLLLYLEFVVFEEE